MRVVLMTHAVPRKNSMREHWELLTRHRRRRRRRRRQHRHRRRQLQR